MSHLCGISVDGCHTATVATSPPHPPHRCRQGLGGTGPGEWVCFTHSLQGMCCSKQCSSTNYLTTQRMVATRWEGLHFSRLLLFRHQDEDETRVGIQGTLAFSFIYLYIY